MEVRSESGRSRVRDRGIEDRKILVADFRLVDGPLRNPGLDRKIGEILLPHGPFERSPLIAAYPRQPKEPHDVAMAGQDLVREDRKFAPIDLVGGIEKGPQRLDFVEICVEPLCRAVA
jgi:hypothetical protein